MNFKLLGRTGLRVSELSLGTMTFGEEWGWGANKTESKKIFDAYANAGGNFLDTANRYTEGTSEKMLADFIKPDRDHFVLATKYTLYDKLGDVNYSGNHRKNMMRSVESSLKRLNTDFIDLFYLHAWDYTTPVEEVLRGMDDLVRSGKVLYAGISDTPAWIVSKANTIADMRGWTRFNALQIEYSLVERTPERDLLPMAMNEEIAVTAWAPLAGGALTGKYLKNDSDSSRMDKDNPRLNERNIAIAQAVVDVAGELGCTPAQVAVKWTMEYHNQLIPIVGATKESQIKDSLGALDVQFSSEQLEKLNEVSKIKLGFPHEFLKDERIGTIIYGGDKNKIKSHR
jgi:aryl-alcohol dehydrogenase-like predicted oxidoreductase